MKIFLKGNFLKMKSELFSDKSLLIKLINFNLITLLIMNYSVEEPNYKKLNKNLIQYKEGLENFRYKLKKELLELVLKTNEINKIPGINSKNLQINNIFIGYLLTPIYHSSQFLFNFSF